MNEGMTILLTTRDARRGSELALVLESRAFSVAFEQIGRTWVLRVPADQVEDAVAELAQYARENPPRAATAVSAIMTGAGWPGVVVYVVLLIGIVPLVREDFFGRDWLQAGRVDSAAIFAGQWWRAATGLTLHADAAHLLGNAGFGAFFGYSLGRSVGGGFAWLLILLCGIAGNLVNAWFQGPAHRAIGASTAVFAALGILTGYSWRTGFRAWASWRQRVAPIVAGVGLLAFTGTAGANTDIGAHLLGFLAGFGAGAAITVTGWPQHARSQLLCGAAALAIVVGAWSLALAA